MRRLALHSALASRAHDLGVTRVTARVRSVAQDADGVTVDDLRGSWLLGCDGLRSTVRREAGLDRPTGGDHRFGLRRHFEVAPWSDLIEVHWTPTAEVYVTPVSGSVVGIAVLGPQRTGFAETLASVPALAERLASAEPASTLRGAGPFRQRASRPSSGRVLLVGDASGYVDAITGEGLRLGFEQARVAIESIGDGGDYDRRWRRATRDFRMLTAGLVAAATSPARGGIVRLAASAPRLYGAIVERLAR